MSFRYQSPDGRLGGTLVAAPAAGSGYIPGGPGATGHWRSSTISLFGLTGDDERATISVSGVQTGPAKIGAACQGECATMRFYLRPTINGVPYLYDCRLSAGTVTVSTRSDDRIAGTFSGTGSCTATTTPDEPAIQVTDGAFDITTIPKP
jgi:hypothetical protein